MWHQQPRPVTGLLVTLHQRGRWLLASDKLWIVLAAIVVVFGLRGSGLLDRSALYSYDILNQIIATRAVEEGRHHKPRVVIIGLTEDDVRQFATLPLPDQVIADLVLAIDAAEPRAIGLTSTRDIPVPPGHDALKAVFANKPHLIGIQHFPTDRTERILPPAASSSKDQAAISNILIDLDGHFRRILIQLDDPEHEGRGSALPWRLAEEYLGVDGQSISVSRSGDMFHLGDRAVPRIDGPMGEYRRAKGIGSALLIPMHRNITYPTYSFHDLLEGRVPTEMLQDSVVVIGVTAQSLTRQYPTPLTRQWLGRSELTPSINILAHHVDDLIAVAKGEWHPARWMPEWANHALIAFLLLLFFGISIRIRSTLVWFTCFLAFSTLVVMTAATALRWGLWIPVVPVILGALLCGAGLLHHRLQKARKLKLQVDILQTIIDKLPEPIYVIDERRRLQAFNEAYARLCRKLPRVLKESVAPVPPDPPPHEQWLTYENDDGEVHEVLIDEGASEGRHRGIRVGLIKSMVRSYSPDFTTDDQEQLERRLSQVHFWASHHDQPLFLVGVTVEDRLDGRTTGQLLDAIRDRLSRQYPDAEILFKAPEKKTVYALIRGEVGEEPPDSDSLARQFDWPLDIDSGPSRPRIMITSRPLTLGEKTLKQLLPES